ncbi:hypothetical protein RUM44_006233 [Polyplax serrata]|uniref:Uncharacterized protein n=1 Tax=Polyplax serrata TaxID=468196 RepID=A0ABR1AHJ1_POLSC
MLKSGKILRQEEEFVKLNAEIDTKTQTLLKEVEEIKSLDKHLEGICGTLERESLSSYVKDTCLENPVISTSKEILNPRKSGGSANTLTESESKLKRKLCQSAKATIYSISTTNVGQQAVLPLGVTRNKSEHKLRQGILDNQLIPESIKGIGQEGTIKFLTAKVKVLADQLQVMQKEEKKFVDRIKELQVEKEKAVDEKEKLTQQVNTAKNVLVKCEQHCQTLVTQLQTTQAEKGHLKKELEKLNKEVRQNKQCYSANELKLNRTLEEVEKLRLTIQQMKKDEKELKESNRKRMDGLVSAVKSGEKQRVELLNAFKKQLVLIDNLKRQNGLIEVAKLLKSAEDDFINFLDCNPPT